jgi:RimJ/RimL family protein N-acetyltransferase
MAGTSPAMTPPTGPIVDPASARAPQRVTLEGRSIRLEPLAPTHADALFPACARPEDADLWAYMGDGPFDSREAFAENIARKSASADPLFYALVDPATGLAAGHASLMRIDPPNRVVEVGNIMYGRSLQRSRAATEAIYLLAKYVFEDLGYRRFEWKCNDLNAPSRRAALRFGFAFEGVFRQHMIVKGRNRDTAWYSMLDSEWPARKAAFEGWLAPENFDASGRQIASLAALNGDGGM